MLGTLTAQDLMVTFKTRKVGPMFVDSLLEHNVVALNVVAEDLKRRGEQKIFPNLIFKAFEDGFTAKYDDVIVDSLRTVMFDIRDSHPLNMAIWAFLEKNRSKGELLDKDDFFNEIGKREDDHFDRFCRSLSPYKVATMDFELFNILVEHYAEGLERPVIEEGIMDKEHEAQTRIRETAKFYLRDHLQAQLEEIRLNEMLIAKMKPAIKKAFCIRS